MDAELLHRPKLGRIWGKDQYVSDWESLLNCWMDSGEGSLQPGPLPSCLPTAGDICVFCSWAHYSSMKRYHGGEGKLGSESVLARAWQGMLLAEVAVPSVRAGAAMW